MKAKLSLLAFAAIAVNAAWISPVTQDHQDKKEIVSSVHFLNPNFSFVRSHRQGKGITTTWAISSNDGVLGFTVQKTYEDPTDPYAMWEDICSMPCDPTRSYKHTDNDVFPGYVNYRVVAFMDNGSSVVSEYTTTRIPSR